MTISVGNQAPDFELPSTANGGHTRLSETITKQNVLLAFYPKDGTSG